jgi:hypothetical protein
MLLMLLLVGLELWLSGRLRLLLLWHVPETFVSTHHILLSVLFAQILIHLSVNVLKMLQCRFVRRKNIDQVILGRATLITCMLERVL